MSTNTAPPPTPPIDPIEASLLHRTLLFTNALQSLSIAAVALSFGLDALVVIFAWSSQHDFTTSLLAGAALIAAAAIQWALLAALPRTGRSFGPDKPPALALAAFEALVLIALAVLAAPLWLGVFVLVVILLGAFYATWIEPFRLQVTRQIFAANEWDAHTPPLKLLHIGDIHVERISPRERRLNQLVKQLQPDLILFSGDFVSLSYTYDPDALQAIRSVISEWRAPLGVYAVPGTPLVEPSERVAEFVKDIDTIKLLTDQWASVGTPGGKLHILGMTTTHQLDVDREAFQKVLPLMPSDGLKLMLRHSPGIAPEADAAGFDLYLCGHTHGGQIRLPLIGALMTSSETGRRFVIGRYRLHRLTLYVTRGVGMEGMGAPRARFLCPPEIVLWEIRGSRERH